jgi:putative ABC transport system permease protein
MSSPRWRKVFRDILSSKLRLVLVVLSIAAGVAAIGMVITTQLVVSRDLLTSFETVNPASATLYVAGFDDEILNSVRRMPEIAAAQPVASLGLRYQVGSGANPDWKNIALSALPDYNNIQINKITPQAGAWPPPDKSVLIERSALELIGKQIGDTLTVETPDGRLRALKIAGLVHDMNMPSARFINRASGFVTFETLQWLGFPRFYSEMNILVAEKRTDKAHIEAVGKLVATKLEKSGISVYYTYIPEPGQHWFQPYLTPMTALLSVLGTIALMLSGFLVVNTISALLTSQVRQIGMMKAVGGRNTQVIGLYLVMVLIYGLLALAVAVPLGWLGARMLTQMMVSFVNFDLTDMTVPPLVLALQAALALLVPVLAAIFPVLSGTRVSVREAVSSYGLGQGEFGSSWVDRLLGRVRGLSRPMLLALRNTFRKRGRLTLTLLTLTLGSAIFVAVASLYSSMMLTLDQALNYFNYEISVQFNRPYRVEQIDHQLSDLTWIQAVENWGMYSARIKRPNGSESGTLLMITPPSDTQMIKPVLVSGRWLEPGDQNALVINTDVLKEDPDIKVGDRLTILADDREFQFTVVGIVRTMLTNPPFIYTNYEYFSRLSGDVGRSWVIYVRTQPNDALSQTRYGKLLEERLESRGINVGGVSTTAELRDTITRQFQLIIVFIMTMAIILAVVGGLGLMGTMSLNVLERTREIGVMRAVGADSGSIVRIVQVEAVIIGLISFCLGTLISLPVGQALCQMVGQGFLRSPIAFKFSLQGMLLWLVSIILISMIASWLPARNAARLSVRDILAYE